MIDGHEYAMIDPGSSKGYKEHYLTGESALGDDEKSGEWEESWEFESLDADGWERLSELDEEAFKPTAVSYATAAQRIPGEC